MLTSASQDNVPCKLSMACRDGHKSVAIERSDGPPPPSGANCDDIGNDVTVVRRRSGSTSRSGCQTDPGSARIGRSVPERASLRRLLLRFDGTRDGLMARARNVLHDSTLILTLMGGLTSALVLGLITQKLRLSPIVGYLLAGVIVGPFTPGFVADGHIAEQFAELGVILLMFGVGLHFHLADLLAVRKVDRKSVV